jgi:predicted Zn-dependent protease with MMP-like domain
MNKVTDKEFDKLVESGIKAIPERFLKLIDNVAIVVEDEPTASQKKKLDIRKGWTLFGLYEGISQTRRGDHYTSVVPDKITIFKKPIEQAARDGMDLREIVKNTLWHEIAHHFGLDEHSVREAEMRRKKDGSQE